MRLVDHAQIDNALMETVGLEVAFTDLVEEGSASNVGEKESIEDDFEETEYEEDEKGDRYVGVNSTFCMLFALFVCSVFICWCFTVLIFYYFIIPCFSGNLFRESVSRRSSQRNIRCPKRYGVEACTHILIFLFDYG